MGQLVRSWNGEETYYNDDGTIWQYDNQAPSWAVENIRPDLREAEAARQVTAQHDFFTASERDGYIAFGAALTAQYYASDLAGQRAIAAAHPGMGIYNEGPGGLLWWGPMFTPAGDGALDKFLQAVTKVMVVASVAIGAGAAIAAGAGATGAGAVGAEGAAAGAAGTGGTVGLEAGATTIFAGETAAGVGASGVGLGATGGGATGLATGFEAALGVDASTGLFAGETAAGVGSSGVGLGGVGGGATGLGAAAPASSLFSTAAEVAQSAALSAAKSALPSVGQKAYDAIKGMFSTSPTAAGAVAGVPPAAIASSMIGTFALLVLALYAATR